MLYAEYVKEAYGRECIENEHGFITYSINGEVCHLDVLYTKKSSRKTGHAGSIYEIFLSKLPPNVKILICEVDTKSNDPEQSLIVIFSRGFKVLDNNKDRYIRLWKQIGGS